MTEENNENGLDEETTLGQEVDELLEKGYSQKEIRNQGFSPSLVRQRVRRRTKRLGQPAPGNKTNGGKGEVALTIKEKEQVLPEWLESQVGELYDGNEQTKKVFMAGMSVPLLGMRLFAESFKPMLALMQTYQQGQAEAVKAAQGGAEDVAQQTVVQAIPYFTEAMKDIARSSSPNPMASMMSRMLEQALTPMMGNIMSAMLPKQPGQQGQGQQAQANPSGLPPGWVQTEQK